MHLLFQHQEHPIRHQVEIECVDHQSTEREREQDGDALPPSAMAHEIGRRRCDQRQAHQAQPPDVVVQPVGDLRLARVAGHILLAAREWHDEIDAQELGNQQEKDAAGE
jgi:hypothetical protein